MSRHILVVDDDLAIQDFVSMALTNEGYEVVTASDGEAALRQATEAQPALILLDMRMPNMDGPAFIDAYQKLAISPAPIIVLTAGRGTNNALVPFTVAGFLPKPFDLDELLLLVEQFVAL